MAGHRILGWKHGSKFVEFLLVLADGEGSQEEVCASEAAANEEEAVSCEG